MRSFYRCSVSVKRISPLQLSRATAEKWSRSTLFCGKTIESQNGLGWKGPQCSSHSNPLLCAGSPTTSPGCPEPHPAWPWMPPGMGHPQPPWATCSVRHHPLGEKLPPHIQPKPPLSQFKTIPPCPITLHPHKQPFPLLFIRSLQVLEGHYEVSPQPSPR